MENTNVIYLSHFTSIDNLDLILKTRNIRFTRLDLVDDISETKFLELESISKLVYVSCWTKQMDENEDNIALWSMYAANMHGVKIILPFFPFIIIMDNKEYYINDVPSKTKCELKGFNSMKVGKYELNPNIFSLKESAFGSFYCEIDYYDDFNKEKEEVLHEFEKDDCDLAYYSFENIGRKKHNCWKFSNELRYFLLYSEKELLGKILDGIKKRKLCDEMDALKTKEFIDIPIHEKALKEMKVIIGPKCTESEIDIVNIIIEKYNNSIQVEHSKLKGLIR